jgi:hypothetical protein
VHRVESNPDEAGSQDERLGALRKREGRIPGQQASEAKEPPVRQERNPELVARVKSIRGRFKHTGGVLASEELHRERQADKAKEEQKAERFAP